MKKKDLSRETLVFSGSDEVSLETLDRFEPVTCSSVFYDIGTRPYEDQSLVFNGESFEVLDVKEVRIERDEYGQPVDFPGSSLTLKRAERPSPRI